MRRLYRFAAGLLASLHILLYAYFMGTVRQQIPALWAEKGHCPLCNSAQMCVLHPSEGADQLSCTRCGLAFELEMDGARLHVTHWPDALPFLNIMSPDEWRTVSELRNVVKQPVSTPAKAAPVMPPPAGSSPASLPGTPVKPDSAKVASPPPAAAKQPAVAAPDAAQIELRVKSLRALGDSQKDIRTILTRAEKDPDRAKAILKIIDQMERKEQARQGKKLVWSLTFFVIVVMIVAGVGYYFLRNSSQENQPVASDGGSALQDTKTLSPNMVVKIMKLETPVVNQGVVPTGKTNAVVTLCPHTADDAAALFGGDPVDWYYPPSANGWVMVRKEGTSANIYIPKGMKAAYLQLGNNLQLVEVLGPATLNNAHYVAVSCP